MRKTMTMAVALAALAVTPAAMLQGRNRYERFCNYRTYLADNCPEWAAQNVFHEIDGSGHDSIYAHTEKPFIDYVLGVK